MEHTETFWTLMRDLPHWEFELFVSFVEQLVSTFIIGMIAWPFIKKHWNHHKEADKIHGFDKEKKPRRKRTRR